MRQSYNCVLEKKEKTISVNSVQLKRTNLLRISDS